jgi:tetratricopeptide (TPR) repeat protein
MSRSRFFPGNRVSVARLAGAAATAGFLFLTSADARAGGPNATAADSAFREAKSLLAAGKVHEACEKFAASLELDPQLGTQLNLASCHEKEGKSATALAEYGRLIEAASKRNDSARVKYARDRVTELERNVPRVRLEIADVDKVRSLELDDKAVPRESWSNALPVDPGEHVIVVTSTSGQSRDNRFRVEAKASEQTVAVQGPAAGHSADEGTQPPPPVGGKEPVEPPPAAGSGSKGPWKALGIVSIGLGAVGTAVGAVFGAKALSSKSDVDKGCDGNLCTPEGFAAQDDARSAAKVSTISFIAGGAFLVVGVGILIFAPSSAASARVQTRGSLTEVGWSVRF